MTSEISVDLKRRWFKSYYAYAYGRGYYIIMSWRQRGNRMRRQWHQKTGAYILPIMALCTWASADIFVVGQFNIVDEDTNEGTEATVRVTLGARSRDLRICCWSQQPPAPLEAFERTWGLLSAFLGTFSAISERIFQKQKTAKSFDVFI